jgi:hypothetical protein
MDAAPLTSPSAPARLSFLDWLVETQSLTLILAERVARVHSDTSGRLVAILLKSGLLSEARPADQMARYCKLPRLEPAMVYGEPVSMSEINTSFLRARGSTPAGE